MSVFPLIKQNIPFIIQIKDDVLFQFRGVACANIYENYSRLSIISVLLPKYTISPDGAVNCAVHL